MLTSPDHSRDRPKRFLALRVLRNAALGSATGIALVLLSYAGSASSSTDLTLGRALVGGALLGPIMSLTLMVTKSWRTDLVGHYASWTVAGLVAGLVVGGWLILDDPTTPGLTFGFGAFLGLCFGLGLGALFRWLREDDGSTRQ
jgi:hypothetical protein